MALEPWLLVAIACTAVGVAALAARAVLRMVCHLQERRLARENRALAHWWSVLADVPGEVLDAQLRRSVGRVMLRRLDHAARLSSNHPYLQSQREAINRFITGTALDVRGPLRRDGRTRPDRARHMEALKALHALMEDSAAARLLSRQERTSAAAAIGRAIETVEFLEARHANVQAADLRRVTRALGRGSAPGFAGPQSRRLFPTQ